MSEAVVTQQQEQAVKYRPYPEYKDSGVEWLGPLPNHWVITCIKRLSSGAVKSFTDGDWIESPYITDDGVRLIQTGNIGIGKYKEQGFRFIANNTFVQLRCTEVKPNDVLICRLADPVGRACLAPSLQDRMITSVDVSILKLDKNIDERYVVYFLTSSEYLGHLNAAGRGGTRQRIARSDLGDVAFALPSIHEQRTITAFLDHETARIDRLIAKQQQLIELLKEKRQAVISHAVTKGLNPDAPMKDSGVEWLGQVPVHWDTPKLFYVTSRVGDGLHSTPIYQDGTGYYFVNGNNLDNGYVAIGSTAKEIPFEEYQSHYIHLDETSVLLSINGTIGNVALYRQEPIILGKSAAYVNCKAILSPYYLRWYLTTNQAKLYYDLEVTGTTIYNLSLGSIRKMKVLVPPMEEQNFIARSCEASYLKYEELISASFKKMNLLQERRTALISAAVTGKIDLRGWTPPVDEVAA